MAFGVVFFFKQNSMKEKWREYSKIRLQIVCRMIVFYIVLKMNPWSQKVWFGYFRLFTVATGCPSDRRPPEDGYLLRGIVQGYRTKLLRIPPGSLTCSVYSTVTRDLGLPSHPKDNK